MTFPRLQGPLRIILLATVVAAAMGAAYSEMQVIEARRPGVGALRRGARPADRHGDFQHSDLVRNLRPGGPIGAPLRRAPFAVHVAVKSGVYLVVILFGLALGARFPGAGRTRHSRQDVLFSLAASFVFAFMYDVNSLLGQNVLLNFVTGRYHRPRLEARVFLFIDMEGSTGLAERLGPLAFHRLLNRFVVDLTEPIVAARGEIHSYVGDELIATWKLEEGIADGPLRRGLLRRHRTGWRGSRPNTAANSAPPSISAPGLHCGPVVTGEMGSVKKEIVFLGDTVNTTARIQEMCRQTGDRVLASADLVDRLELPPGVAKRSLGGCGYAARKTTWRSTR